MSYEKLFSQFHFLEGVTPRSAHYDTYVSPGDFEVDVFVTPQIIDEQIEKNKDLFSAKTTLSDRLQNAVDGFYSVLSVYIKKAQLDFMSPSIGMLYYLSIHRVLSSS